MPTHILETLVRGKPRFLVDLRRHGEGRKFFVHRHEAEDYLSDLGLLTGVRLSEEDRVEFTNCKHRLARHGANITDATNYYITHNAGLIRKPLRDAIAEFWDVKAKTNRRDRYVDLLKNTLKNLAAWLSDTEGLEQTHEVTRAHVEKWLTSNGWEPITQTKYRGTVSTFFNWAVIRHYSAVNPCLAIEKAIVDPKAPEILTVDQCKTLLRRCLLEANRRTIAFIAVQLFGGLRPTEASKLTWSNIKDGHIEVTTIASKVRHRRLVTINPTLAKWLKLKGDLPLKNSPSWLLRLRYDGTNVNSKATAAQRRKWKEVIPWPHDCLRHTAASMLYPKLGAKDTAIQLGNSETILFRHYRELVTKKEMKAFWGLTPENVKTC